MSGIKIEWTEPGPMCKCRLTVVHGLDSTVEYRDPTEFDLTVALRLLTPEVRERVISGSRPAQETPATRPISMRQQLFNYGLPESWAEWARDIHVLWVQESGLYHITVSGFNGRVIKCRADKPQGPWYCESFLLQTRPWCPEVRFDGWIDPDPSCNSVAHWKFMLARAEIERDQAIKERNEIRSKLDAVRKVAG